MENINQSNVTNANNDILHKKKFDTFIIYAIITAIVAACVFIGPIVFVVLGTATAEGANGKIINPLERPYILSVCIVTLIVCGIAFILILSTLIYKIINRKKVSQ